MNIENKTVFTKPEKAQYRFYLRQEIIEKFQELVAKKYGKVAHGLISQEAEKMMVYWIEAFDNTHKNTQTIFEPQPKIYAIWELVKNHLRKNNGGIIPFECRGIEIQEAIQILRGIDFRTINKYMRLFGENKFIQPHPKNPTIYIIKEGFI